MESYDLEFKEELLLTLYFSNNKSKSTRLMKILFLLEDVFKLNEKHTLDFIAYDYGPWATNYEILVTPLILANVVEFIEETNNKYYLIAEDKRYDLEKLIKKNYISNTKFTNQIKLIKFISENYTSQYAIDLIQFVYFIKPDMTIRSEIKKSIEKYPTDNNQRIISKFIQECPFSYVMNLFSEMDSFMGILKIFKFSGNEIFNNYFFDFLNKIFNVLENNEEPGNIIELISDFPRVNEFKQLKFLNISLFNEFDLGFNEEFVRQYFLLFLKSIRLIWPLNKESIVEFYSFIEEFKNKTKIKSFLNDLPNKIDLKMPEDIKNISIKSEGIVFKKKTRSKINSDKITETIDDSLIEIDEDDNEIEDKKINEEFNEVYAYEEYNSKTKTLKNL